MYKKIFFIGTGRVAKRCIEILKGSGKNFVCLNAYSEKFPVVEPLCKRLNVQYKNFKPKELGEFLFSLEEKSLIVSAHNSYIFPRRVTDKENLTIINFHNAYLPHYRGRNAPTWEIYNGEKFGGATWHFVDSGIDTGKIIVQEKIPIAEDETALSLLMKSAEVGSSLFEKYLDILISANRNKGGGIDTGRLYLSHEMPNDGYFDLRWDFEKAYRFLRATDYHGTDIMPRPKIELKGEIYQIEDYEISDFDTDEVSEIFCVPSSDRNKFLRCRLISAK